MSIEYKNKDAKVTKYWIGIKDLRVGMRSLVVEGLHLANFRLRELYVFIDSILSAKVIEGSYFAVNTALVKDISADPQKYGPVFSGIVNLQILNYLADCHRLDFRPYRSEYKLLENFDEDSLAAGSYRLSERQFQKIVVDFQFAANSGNAVKKIRQLCVNVLSVNTKKGLYVLAYKKLVLDVAEKTLRSDSDITVCKEFTIDGKKQSIGMFLDADDWSLLDDFDAHREEIKDKIAESVSHGELVDDLPYLLTVEADIVLDLETEYAAIYEMYGAGKVTKPIMAFFGDLVERPSRRKASPLALLNRKVNLDQLLAINNAMKFPLAYVQGPPGTGKTNTILNTVSTAFFNNRTVLFSSYNNHPIDSVFKALSSLKYNGHTIPFPVIRLGNNEKMGEAVDYIRELYAQVKQLKIFSATLDKHKDEKIARTKRLTELLKKHEELLDLKERKETILKMLSSSGDLTFASELQARQLREIETRIAAAGEVSDADALALLSDDFGEYYKYLYYTSASYIKRIGDSQYNELREILSLGDKDKQIAAFNKYLSDEKNLAAFLKIFPVVITTCISAHKLGPPRQYFDMVILDEASQCNTAVSLVPIIRGDNLMLVGDPQQLDPVILLDDKANSRLRQKYGVSPEYDYIANSIYKTFLACDAVSDEVLLRYHYRCNKKIIGFNNKKYYNDKLRIKSASLEEHPLVFVDVRDGGADRRNTAPAECEQIVRFVKANRDKSIGIITPFVNQKILINEALADCGIEDVTCGTVHAFQGDEKDIILFSLAVTDRTSQRTYDWLKTHKELINVAVSRAKNQLILFANTENLERLHTVGGDDDIYELAQYVRSNGTSRVTGRQAQSRALGIKPYSTETEEAFLENLDHALGNIRVGRRQYEVKKEVPIAHVFRENFGGTDLFYTGRFDFVVYDKRSKTPVFAIELDGKEHFDDETVRKRDAKKQKICWEHNFELIRVENSYARRYAHIKNILIDYFSKV